MGFVNRALWGVAAAAFATKAVRQTLESTAPGGKEQWIRTNHRGEPISLMEGPAVAVGTAVGALCAGSGSGAERVAQSIASIGAGGFGLYDDLAEDTSTKAKGLKGHLGALAQGNLTTGGLKIIGIGATAFASALISNGSKPKRNGFDVLLDSVVIAGAANLWNLLDLRPGRALKATVLASTPLCVTGATGVAPALGACAAALPADLGERDMLGDSGANALGAFVGTVFTQRSCRTLRLAGAVGIVSLTLASEKVSFSQVISQTPWLNKIDMLGRRPANGPATSASAGESNQ